MGSFVLVINISGLSQVDNNDILGFTLSSGVASVKAMRGQACPHETLKLFMVTQKG